MRNYYNKHLIKFTFIILFKLFLLTGVVFMSIIIAEIVGYKYAQITKLNEKIKYIEDTLEYSRQHEPNIGCYDKDLGWSFKPQAEGRLITSEFDVAYAINSLGIRDKEIPLEKPGGEFRIIALGESQVFGHGINYGKRFTEIIENALNKVEIINMGVWGFGADQSFLQLQRDGFRFNADLAILFITEEFFKRCEDFIRVNTFKPHFILNEEENNLILQDLVYIQKKFGSENFDIKNKITEKNLNIGKRKNIFKNSRLLTLINYSIKLNELKEIDKKYWKNINSTLDTEKKIKSGYDEERFQKLIFLIIKKFKGICNGQKVNFLIINIDTHPISYVFDFCRKLDISYLDLSMVLSSASKLKSLRFEIDPHYNEFTHRVIGEYVANYLKDEYSLSQNKSFTYHFLSKL